MKQRFTVTVKRSRKEKVPDAVGFINCYRYVEEPSTQEVVEVTVDLERIARSLGPKACRSKGKRAQAMSGLVVVRKV